MSRDLDAADMAALQAGDAAALDRLMERWQVPLRVFLERQVRPTADALDLAQETFVRVYRSRDRFRAGARFSTWMFQIAVNLARDHARRRARRPVEPLEVVAEPAADTDVAAELERGEAATAVRAAIDALPDDQREAILLAEYEQLSHAEIGEIVGTSPKAIEMRLARARQTLRSRLAKWLRA